MRFLTKEGGNNTPATSATSTKLAKDSQTMTVMVPQEAPKHKVETAVPVVGRLSRFVEGWEHITNDPYIPSIVSQGYHSGV